MSFEFLDRKFIICFCICVSSWFVAFFSKGEIDSGNVDSGTVSYLIYNVSHVIGSIAFYFGLVFAFAGNGDVCHEKHH